MSRSLPTDEVRVPVKFAHVVLRSGRFEETVAWYRALLGAAPVFENPMISFMTYDDEHHRIAIVNTANAPQPPKGAVGMDHVAFTYDTLGDLLQNYLRLKKEGIEPVWCINHGPTTSLYYEDPDGNRVELQIDNFETEAELKGWMETGAFAKNPIGVTFDPDKLAERYRNGDPLEELVQQGSAT